MLYWFLKFLAEVLFKVLFRFEVRGRENVPRRGGFVIASNHASYLDPIALGAASPRKLNFLAKQELFNSRLFSLLISTLGAFPLRQDRPIAAMNEAIDRLAGGVPLVIFPQGARQPEDELNDMHPGVGFLSIKAGVPILPTLIEGSGLALPIDAKFIRPKKIKVTFACPFEPTGKQYGNDYNQISEDVLDILRNLKCAQAKEGA